ncbi:MAG: sensor histidine kinase [Candidatus Odinarchaeota archaeon]
MKTQPSNWFKSIRISLFSWFSKQGNKLTEPSPDILDPRDYRQARLLSLITLTLMFLILILLFDETFRLLSLQTTFTDSYIIIDMVSVLLLLFAYTKSRSYHYWIGSLLITAYMYFMAYFFIMGFSSLESPDFGYLILALTVLMTAMFFPAPRQSISLSLTGFAGLVMMEIFILSGDIVTHFFRLASVFLFVLLSAIYSILVDRDRLEIIRKSSDYLLEKKKVETIITAYPGGILALDNTGRVIAANEQARHYYLEVAGREIHAGETCFDFPASPLTEALVQLFRMQKNQVLSFEAKKGLFLQLTSAVAFADPVHLIVDIQDVTPLVEFEHARRRFVTSISHEFRTPVSVISSSRQILEKYADKLTGERITRLNAMIDQNVDLLVMLVKNLSFLTRIDEGNVAISWERFRLRTLVEETFPFFASRFEEKSISFLLEVPAGIEMLGDPFQIGQILRILLDNAITYSEEQDSVVIRAFDNYQGPMNPDGVDCIVLQIQDTGRGIKQENLPFIFDRFYRADDVEDISGSGLGLSIAKELVELHHGHISVESERGKGSTFSVVFPKLEYPEQVTGSTRKRVLRDFSLK